MIVDSANLTHTNSQTRPEREVTPDPDRDSNVNNKGIPEAGQTSEIAPAVVTNISAATLETSRAVNAPEQIAEEVAADDIVEAERKEQLPSLNQVKSPVTGGTMIDTSV